MNGCSKDFYRLLRRLRGSDVGLSGSLPVQCCIGVVSRFAADCMRVTDSGGPGPGKDLVAASAARPGRCTGNLRYPLTGWGLLLFQLTGRCDNPAAGLFQATITGRLSNSLPLPSGNRQLAFSPWAGSLEPAARVSPLASRVGVLMGNRN